MVTNARTAEMCKLTENSFRDVNIAFAQRTVAHFVPIRGLTSGINQPGDRHPRVNILQPGPGVGGHCIAVDPWFIVAQNPDQARLIRTAREVNDSKPHWVLNRLKPRWQIVWLTVANGPVNSKIACFGPASKLTSTICAKKPGDGNC